MERIAERKQPRKAQDVEQEYTFTKVELLRNQTLGTGSYGAVCKAKCDQLVCAAKLLYPVLLQVTAPDPGKEHRHPFQRFEEECRFLSRINHPNIVQYLGTYHDPETNSPVLLMELMDKSLTHFLESSPGDISYHIQVNLCYDIAQALAFLHANGIIHRDLSSNNVLLIANCRAKITDFRMSKFMDLNMAQTATMTKCPGTPAFMSPEALDEPPVYTEKLDIFSFGVLVVQTVTRQFPKPTDRFEVRELFDARNQVIQARVVVPEVERRQSQISLIEPTHPLLPIALDSLKDSDMKRPSSELLCQTLDALKRTAKYEESSRKDVGQLLRDKDRQIRENQEQIRAKNEQLQVKDELIQDRDQKLHQKTEENKTLKQDKQDKQALQHETESKERQLRKLNQQLESSEETTARLQQAIHQRDREVNELRQALASKSKEIQNLSTRFHQVAIHKGTCEQRQATPTNEEPFTMVWESLPDAPVGMRAGSSAVIRDKAYFRTNDSQIIYEFSNNQWQALPKHPINSFTIASIDNILTTVGGWLHGVPSNKLYSYINTQWVELFPPMQTKLKTPADVYTSNTLVVAGGYDRLSNLTTVETLNTQTKQWSSVSSLPVAVSHPLAVICRDCVYIHSRVSSGAEKCSLLKCSLSQLTRSKLSSVLWKKIASLPVCRSSLVAVNGHLLAVGGKDSHNHPTNDIYQYNSSNNLWTVVSQMSTTRFHCLTALLPGDKLMVMGGYYPNQKKIEVAYIYYIISNNLAPN